ncbi:MAG TPA: phosphodiesterase [Nitrospiraceae bacterium]|nr:phosphodiesterase [Nitrospiraceae bacterium]
MSTKKIPIQHLRVGMFIVGLDRPWLDTPFLFHRKKIKNQEQIDKLIDYGIKEVVIDTKMGIDSKTEPDLSKDKDEIKPVEFEKTSFASFKTELQNDDPFKLREEMPKAKKIKAEVTNLMKGVFNDTRMGKSIELRDVKKKVTEIVESLFRNRDALWCLSHIKDYDEYTFSHSVNVCVLTASFGRHLGMSKERLKDIALGGLLHDIGKSQIPEGILNKPGKYTQEEFNIMKCHVEMGADLLHKYKDIPEDAMLVTFQHHERWNGTGYSKYLHGDEISLVGQITSICDVYDAMTTERVYRKATQPHLILKNLYEWGDTLFNRALVEKFIQYIGIYPFGSFVKLNNGSYGVIVSKNHKELLRPNVLIVSDINRSAHPPTLIDLSSEKDKDGNYKYSIEEVLDPVKCGIDTSQYISRSISG